MSWIHSFHLLSSWLEMESLINAGCTLSHTHITMKQRKIRLGHSGMCGRVGLLKIFCSRLVKYNNIKCACIPPATHTHPTQHTHIHVQLQRIFTFVTFCYHHSGNIKADYFHPQIVCLVNSSWLSFPKGDIHPPLHPPNRVFEARICTLSALLKF